MAQKVFAHRHLGHRCNYIQKPFRNTLYYKACTKHFPVILCTTKLARSTSQYYFVLQSLNKALPSTTLYYQACTKYFPLLLCTTKLAQSTSKYYFVLPSLHKVFPVLLCTTKPAQTTFQYYCALQSLQKVLPTTTLLQSLCKALPSTTLLYKACTKHFQELLCTTRLAQSIPSTTLYSTTLYYKACTNYFPVPVVPHKAVAEVSKIGNL